ncbi:hypothetical protein GC163_12170 [bacterium]|nr:hypothetical protein [bacterium]
MSWRGNWWYWLRYRLFWRFVISQAGYKLSASQTGEDMIVRSLLESVRDGFYVDVGAYHPVQFSNTYHFYLQGWHGLIIDANQKSINQFRMVRPRDKRIHACVGVNSGARVNYLSLISLH